MPPTTTEVTCSPTSLHRLRLASGLSLTELGALAGLSRNCVDRIERGERTARAVTTRALADALGVTPYDLHPDSRANVEVIAATIARRRAA